LSDQSLPSALVTTALSRAENVVRGRMADKTGTSEVTSKERGRTACGELKGPRVVSAAEAVGLWSQSAEVLGAERVAIVPNPAYVWAPFEIYPLAPRREKLSTIKAVAMDMDGTTTTTEPLCLHSLEHTVRAVSGLAEKERWSGFDRKRDLPHLIGDSTTRHVEYLVETFGSSFQPELFARWFLWSASWTLVRGRDPGRKREVEADLTVLAPEGLKEDKSFQSWGRSGAPEQVPEDLRPAVLKVAQRLEKGSSEDRVRAAVTIYYQRYHAILEEIAQEGRSRTYESFSAQSGPPIAPMPGVPVFLAMVKGFLGEEALQIAPLLGAESSAEKAVFCGCCSRFASRPAQLAMVTSSIRYEAEIVLGEVLRLIREEVSSWPVSSGLSRRLNDFFRSPEIVYDAFVTASDSSEIRLKPHRDLYAMALQRMGLSCEDYAAVLGLEDSTAGVIAMKAAGCGLAVAVPFAETSHHDFSAADHVVKGGLREIILRHGCYLSGA